MKLDDVQASDIEIRRGGGGKMAAGGGLAGIIALVIALLASRGGGGGGGGTDALGQVLSQMGGGAVSAESSIVDGSKLEGQEKFVGQIITLLDQYWSKEASALGVKYSEPGMVVFSSAVPTGGCGTAQPEFGPFYCPGDSKIYIDLEFYKKLQDQLDFDGDFAMAYVLAHEFGHHIENLQGTLGGGRDNATSVRIELQADCYAGAWGNYINEDGRITEADFNDAIQAANAVGDDAIQGPNANRDTFTHGSSAEREQAFRTGFKRGDPRDCTYNT